MVVMRVADDFVVGFEHREDAVRFLADRRARFAPFGLSLHPDKTRLIEFGRFAVSNWRARGAGKPETFNFLGFTHLCSHTSPRAHPEQRTYLRAVVVVQTRSLRSAATDVHRKPCRAAKDRTRSRSS
jgi:hypothetical protein